MTELSVCELCRKMFVLDNDKAEQHKKEHGNLCNSCLAKLEEYEITHSRDLPKDVCKMCGRTAPYFPGRWEGTCTLCKSGSLRPPDQLEQPDQLEMHQLDCNICGSTWFFKSKELMKVHIEQNGHVCQECVQKAIKSGYPSSKVLPIDRCSNCGKPTQYIPDEEIICTYCRKKAIRKAKEKNIDFDLIVHAAERYSKDPIDQESPFDRVKRHLSDEQAARKKLSSITHEIIENLDITKYDREFEKRRREKLIKRERIMYRESFRKPWEEDECIEAPSKKRLFTGVEPSSGDIDL